MSLFIAMAFGGLGSIFGRMGANKKTSGGGTPVAGTPTFYIYGF